MSKDNPVFTKNLRVLEVFDPRAAVCLSRLPRAAANSGSEILSSNWQAPALQADDTVLLFGIGDGSEIRKVLQLPVGRILVIECDMSACQRVLCRDDLSAALAAGRLRLLLPSTATPVMQEISLRECVADLISRLHSSNGALHLVTTSTAAAHTTFYEALGKSVQNAIAFVGECAQAAAPEVVYDVTVISPSCAIFDDLAQCFHRLGLRTQLLRIPDVSGVWSPEQRRATQLSLASAPSRLVIARNRALLEPEQATDYVQPEALLRGSVAMWWWDVPNLSHYADYLYPRSEAVNFGFARDILPLLPQRSEWLPPGARSAFVEAGMQPEIEQDIGVSFVGQSRRQSVHGNLATLASVLRGLGGHAPALARDLDRLRSYVELHAYLYSHQADINSAIDGFAVAYPVHAYFLRYLLEMAVTGAFRVAAIEQVLKQGIEVAIYGDEDWLNVPGVNAKNFKGVINPAQLPSLFRRSRINLNLNFMQVSSTINPKVLDIAAAGGVALTDYRPELDVLYRDPASRPFAFDSIDQLAGKIESLLQLDLSSYRRRVHDYTCRHHTLQQRAHWLAHKFGLM